MDCNLRNSTHRGRNLAIIDPPNCKCPQLCEIHSKYIANAGYAAPNSPVYYATSGSNSNSIYFGDKDITGDVVSYKITTSPNIQWTWYDNPTFKTKITGYLDEDETKALIEKEKDKVKLELLREEANLARKRYMKARQEYEDKYEKK